MSFRRKLSHGVRRRPKVPKSFRKFPQRPALQDQDLASEGYQKFSKASEGVLTLAKLSHCVRRRPRKFPKALESFRRDQRLRIILVSVGSCPTVSEGVRKFPKAFVSFRMEQHSRIGLRVSEPCKMSKGSKKLQRLSNTSEGSPWCLKASECFRKLSSFSDGTSAPRCISMISMLLYRLFKELRCLPWLPHLHLPHASAMLNIVMSGSRSIGETQRAG